MLPAIQVNWTKPFFDRKRLRGDTFKIVREMESVEYDMPDFQFFYSILSAIHWKHHNTSLKLYTDTPGMEFLKKYNLTDLYDEIDTRFLDMYSKSKVDAAHFFTSGKIKVMGNQTEPFIFLDQDMIIRQKLPAWLFDNDLLITHWEIPHGDFYFDEERWNREIEGIEYPKNYSHLDLMVNTSFLAFKNIQLLRDYTVWHQKLVNIENETPNWYWLVSDQGILGHCIREKNYTVNTLTDRVFLSSHTYGNEKTRKFGKSEPWYYPTTAVNIEKDKIEWEHIWLEKIHYAYHPDYEKTESQRMYNEIVECGYDHLVNHERFKKYESIL